MSHVSVSVRPEMTEIIGLNGPVEDGSVVGLTCRTRGARPAAWITWYNGSAPFAETPTDDVALMVSRGSKGRSIWSGWVEPILALPLFA